jgi:NADPH2:quinone reductase
VTCAAGAAVGVPYVTAYRALFQKAGLRAGERVLVHGASGGVGTAALQMARAHGAVVIGTAGTEAGQELVRSEGAHAAFDHGSSDYLERIARFAGGVDVILEMLANVNLEHDLQLLAPRGRIVIVGNRGTLEFNPRSTMAKEATVMGTMLWNATPAEDASAHAALVAGLESGVLRPVVGRQLPLDQAARAHEDVLARGAHGKIVLVP